MGQTLQPLPPAARAIGAIARPPMPQVQGVEIVQSIQNTANAVALVRGKTTVARVYLTNDGLGPGRALRGDIAISSTPNGPARYVSSSNAILTASGPAPALSAMRGTTDGGLNFLLPADALSGGSVTARLARLYDANGDIDFNPGAAATASIVAPVKMYVHAVGLRYLWNKSNGTSIEVTPEAFHFDHLKSFLKRAYPISDVHWSQIVVQADPAISPPFSANPPVDPDPVWGRQLDRAHNQLSALRAKDLEGGIDPRTHYYGMISDASAGLFFRGAAKDIPDAPDPSVVAVGPTGNPDQYTSLSWDKTISYGGWYGTHELCHTFGRYHPGFCYQDASDRTFPYPDGRIGDSAHGDMVGFDTGDIELGLPMRAMANEQYHDIMTYCDFQWISSYTYLAVLDRLRQETVQFAPIV